MSFDLDFLNNDNEDYLSYFLSPSGSHLNPNIFTDSINSDITTDKELLLYFLDNLDSMDKQKLIDEGYDKMKIEYLLNTIEEQQQQKKKENLPVFKEKKKKNHMKTTSTGLSYFDENLIICPKNHKKNYCPYLLKCICYLIRKSFEENTVTEKSIGEFFDNITITHAREECVLETITGAKRKRNDKGENDRFHGKTNKEAKMMLIENIKKNLLLMINDNGDETERMYTVDMLLSRLCFDGDLNKHNIIQTMRILPNRTSLTRMNLNIIYPRFSSIVMEDKKFQEELIEMRCPIGDSSNDATITRKRHRKFVWL